MVTKRLAQYAFALLSLLVAAASAQTHTFSFGPVDITNPYGMAAFTKIDGNLPNCGVGYCGAIQIRWDGASNPWWGIECPQQNPDGTYGGWGCPNGGYLLENTVTPDPGQLVWDNPGCGPTIAGCTAHRDTTIPFVNYGLGVVVTVHDTYEVFKTCSPRYCDGNDADDFRTKEQGGTGTETYTPQ